MGSLKLIVEPLEAVMREEIFHPCIIIIDALDECKEAHVISTILRALSEYASRIPPLRFCITSRPVANVVQGFRETGLMNDTSALVLHNIPLEISERDIRVYLEDRLSHTARVFSLPSSWPSKENSARLVEQSGRLFIFAATAARFIDDRQANDPEGQLERLKSTTYASDKALPHFQLDRLYLEVLREAFPRISEVRRTRTRLKRVLGTIVLLFYPLGPDSLAALLSLKERAVRSTLLSLHSTVIVPDAGDECIRLIHPSSYDFLIDVNRCNDVNFVIDSRIQHTLLAEYCLQVLQILSPDMCKIGDASLYNQEVLDLRKRIKKYIPAHVQYACRHWVSHLASGGIHDNVLDLLSRFCSTQLLNWLEVMSLLDELDSAIGALETAHRIVKVSHSEFSA
jgi:hypothetical protein